MKLALNAPARRALAAYAASDDETRMAIAAVRRWDRKKGLRDRQRATYTDAVGRLLREWKTMWGDIATDAYQSMRWQVWRTTQRQPRMTWAQWRTDIATPRGVPDWQKAADLEMQGVIVACLLIDTLDPDGWVFQEATRAFREAGLPIG